MTTGIRATNLPSITDVATFLAIDGTGTVGRLAAAAAAAATAADDFDHVALTKAEADTWASTASDGQIVQVLNDETLGNRHTVYSVASSALVYVRDLGDQTLTTIAKRAGIEGVPRFTLSTLAHFDTRLIGGRNVTSIPFFPLTENLSQSGTTVTAPFGRFTRDYIGSMIYWATGEEAMIVDVPISGWPSSATTCIVDRTQTISSSSATVRPKHLVGAFHGDSVAWRHAPAMAHVLWRALGFGGVVLRAGIQEDTAATNIFQVTLAGGARDATGDNDFANFPWAGHWEVPVSGTLTARLYPQNLGTTQYNPRHGLAPYETAFDTAIIVWRRAAGAFVIERRRVNDADWEMVETIADASTGSTAYGFRKYSHDLRHDWVYRVRSTSSTIEVESIVFRNDSAPGFVYWPIYRGGRLISEFASLSSSALGELCRIVGVPNFRTVIAYDTIGGQTQPEDYLPEIEADRALWAAAAPYMDHVWIEGWQGATTIAEQTAWNRAIVQTALANGDSLVSLEDFFGPFDTTGFRWLEDSIHPGYAGGAVIAHRIMRTLGVFDFPSLDSGRDVNAREGDFLTLRARQMDLRAQILNINKRRTTPERGLKWTTGFAGPFVGVGAMGAALGTADFTVSVNMEVKDPSANSWLFSIGLDGFNFNAAGTILVYMSTTSLVVELKNASANTYQYFWSGFNDIYAGQTGILTLRSDVANDRFDLFWNGEPVADLTATVSALGGGDPLGTWTGTGTDFALQSSTTTANNVFFYHAMAWRSRLTDAQIRAVCHADDPAGTSPDFWWNFDEGCGRMTLDKTANGKHGMIRRSGNIYLIEPDRLTWAHPKRGVLGPAFVMDLNQAVSMLPGDNVIAAFTANRDMRLPATASVNDVFKITVNSTFTIRITQNAGQQIKSGASATTVGTGGHLTIPDATSVTLRCVVGGASTVWVVESHTGAALVFT